MNFSESTDCFCFKMSKHKTGEIIVKATGIYGVKKWDENLHEQISPEMKITKASVEYSMTGEINGRTDVEYLMYYKYYNAADQHKSSAVYVGLMRFRGSMQGKEGSFAIEDRGAFENGEAHSVLQIIAGSGTGDLKSIQGSGHYSADHNGALIELEYTL
jgi:Protein of unknown function (DUF3224)